MIISLEKYSLLRVLVENIQKRGSNSSETRVKTSRNAVRQKIGNNFNTESAYAKEVQTHALEPFVKMFIEQ